MAARAQLPREIVEAIDAVDRLTRKHGAIEVEKSKAIKKALLGEEHADKLHHFVREK
jgi:hypothetical protein